MDGSQTASVLQIYNNCMFCSLYNLQYIIVFLQRFCDVAVQARTYFDKLVIYADESRE